MSATTPAVTHPQDDIDITQSFEDFVAEFLNKCFNLIENSRRENFRCDGTTNEDYLNDEEIAADAAINDTFLRMCINSSPEILTNVTKKLRSYISGKIVEPTVAGGILASMCRSIVQCDPESGLATFIPLLVQAITARMNERPADSTKLDEELQFNLQLLGEVVGPAVGALRLLGHRQQRVQGLPQPTIISTILELQTINRFSQSRRRFHV